MIHANFFQPGTVCQNTPACLRTISMQQQVRAPHRSCWTLHKISDVKLLCVWQRLWLGLTSSTPVVCNDSHTQPKSDTCHEECILHKNICLQFCMFSLNITIHHDRPTRGYKCFRKLRGAVHARNSTVKYWWPSSLVHFLLHTYESRTWILMII
jgi:hypothetical protein